MFLRFVRKETSKYTIFQKEAIEACVHDWDHSISVNLLRSLTSFQDFEMLQNNKNEIINGVTNALPSWRCSKSTYQDDYNLELHDTKKFFIESFKKLIESIQLDTLSKINDDERCKTIYLLLSYFPEAGNSLEEKIKNIINFIESEHFHSIPHINIMQSLGGFKTRC